MVAATLRYTNLNLNSCEWARDSATKRIVSKTTCFLFTIASGYRMQQLANQFHDTMPYTMLAILDEAGATAESYAPMLLGAAMLLPIISYYNCQDRSSRSCLFF